MAVGFLSPTNATGLTKIASGTYTGASALNLSNVLSDTYKFYKLFVRHYGSTTTYNSLRWRQNTTDYTSSVYYGAGGGANTSGTSFNPAANGVNYFPVERHQTSIGTSLFFVAEISRPDATAGYVSYRYWGDGGGRGAALNGVAAGMTNFSGLSIIPDSGTITGEYALYGYTN